jgi:hypothetical protein
MWGWKGGREREIEGRLKLYIYELYAMGTDAHINHIFFKA